MNHKIIFLYLLSSLCYLSNFQIASQIIVHESKVCDLNDATRIILALINHNTLHTVLEPCDVDDVDRLIKNFSPAEMAFEAEVLNWKQPIIIFFVQKNVSDYQAMHQILEQAADTYDPAILFVEIDVDELFKITEQFYFEALPSLCLMHRRVEVNRCEGIGIENFDNQLQEFIRQSSLLLNA